MIRRSAFGCVFKSSHRSRNFHQNKCCLALRIQSELYPVINQRRMSWLIVTGRIQEAGSPPAPYCRDRGRNKKVRRSTQSAPTAHLRNWNEKIESTHFFFFWLAHSGVFWRPLGGDGRMRDGTRKSSEAIGALADNMNGIPLV